MHNLNFQERIERVVFLIALIVILLDVFVWRS